MPNGTYGGVRGTETKVGQRTFVSRPTRLVLRWDYMHLPIMSEAGSGLYFLMMV